jgi:hypothetical protein
MRDVLRLSRRSSVVGRRSSVVRRRSSVVGQDAGNLGMRENGRRGPI